MPANAADCLRRLGEQVRAHRKRLRVSATAAAEAAGMSRVTLHRIEAGEPSVTMGAYLNAMEALGLALSLAAPSTPADQAGAALPARIRVGDFPQLQRLAWQLQGSDELTPQEALDIYERNERHLEPQALAPRERALIDALRQHLRGGLRDV